jgi:hypothetical protein
MPPTGQPVDTRRIVHAWWPLAASWLLMSAELPLLTAVVARLPEPEISLAAYGGIVFPLALIIEAPVIMLLAASTALSRDLATYHTVRRFMMVTGALLTVLHLAVAVTPLYGLVVEELLGAPAEIVAPARLGLVLMTPWTWAIAYRRFNQGLLIRFGRSRTIGVGTALRLSTVAAMLGVGHVLGWPGIAVATAAVAVGVTAEAVYVWHVSRPVVAGPLAEAPPPATALTWEAFGHFYTPLVLTSLMTLLSGPIGSAAISRMPLALPSLAVWPALSGLLFMLRSSGMAFNEVVVALVEEPGATRTLRRFAGTLMLATTGASLLLAATPLSGLWFGRLLGLAPELVSLAEVALWFGVPLAALTVLHSWYQGVLVSARRTRGVSEAVAINLAVTAAVLAIGVATGATAGVHVGAAAMTLGAVAQAVWLRRWARHPLSHLEDRDARPAPELAPEVLG